MLQTLAVVPLTGCIASELTRAFQDYYSHLPEFKDDPFISVIGTTASGISYMAAPIVIPLTKRYSEYRRHMIWVGCTSSLSLDCHRLCRLITHAGPLCLLGLVAGSFARTLGGLILTQGVLYGVGFTIFYYPILSMVNEFWIARRGMAYGFICSASGVSGAAMPLCIHFLLQKYGYQTTLRIMAAGLFVLTGPLIPLLKGRVPETASSSSPRTDWTFLKTPLFWTYSVSNLAMGLGYFFPSLYLPTYATSNGLSSTHGVLLLAAMSISQVVGQLSFGYLSDRKLPLNVLTVSSTLVASIAVYTCWGLAHTFGVLLAFALIYGFFGAGYTATWARMGTTISSEPTAAFAVFGLLNLGKGVGDVLAGPIGGALLMKRVEVGSYGTMDFAAVVLFAGSCMFTSAATISLCYVDFSKFRDALRWLH